MGAAIVGTVGLFLYTNSGILSAYFAADDFSWSNDARTLPLSRLFQVATRAHFYRPVAELWWSIADHGCGSNTACYHAVELGTHILNAVLFLFFGARLFRRRDVAVASALVFVVMPAYVQAVVWVCAVTELLSACSYLLCLHFVLSACGRERGGWYSVAAALAAATALWTHESSATLALTIPLVVWVSPEAKRHSPCMKEILMATLLLAVFSFTTITANRHNYVFTEGHYAIGSHALEHGLDYIRSLYVGRRAISDYLSLSAAAVIIVAAGTLHMRVGASWMLLTMLPFLSFTWGNVGRYTYLPAMGFAWITAGVIVGLQDVLERRVTRSVAVAVAYAVLLVLVARFAAFSHNAIAGQVAWTDHYREYARATTSAPTFRPATGQVVVAPPERPDVDPESVPAMLRWITGKPGLVVKYLGH
jgi:hypothetical protein